MPHSLSFEFDELPLVAEGGKTGAEVSGTAEIAYLSDGDWYVEAVWFQNRTGRLYIERGTAIFNLIVAALDAPKWREAVDQAIADDMAEHGIGPRSDFDEHNTLHRAAQGV